MDEDYTPSDSPLTMGLRRLSGHANNFANERLSEAGECRRKGDIPSMTTKLALFQTYRMHVASYEQTMMLVAAIKGEAVSVDMGYPEPPEPPEPKMGVEECAGVQPEGEPTLARSQVVVVPGVEPEYDPDVDAPLVTESDTP